MKGLQKLLLGCLGMGLVLTACTKDETTEYQVDMSKKATLKGIVYANLDIYENTFMEKAPVGTRLIFETKIQNFNGMVTNDKVYTVETEVGNDGAYEIELPVSKEGVAYTIRPVDFEAMQSYRYIDPVTNDTSRRSALKRFIGNAQVVDGIRANTIRYEDANYSTVN